MEAPSEPIETKPPTLAGLEPRELAGGGAALAVQGRDLGPMRALVEKRLELVEAVGRTLGLDPDRAVEPVLGVPGEAELAGLALHRPEEPHALGLGLEPQVAHGYTRMVTGVPKGSVSARRLMVSLSMRTQPFDTGWPSFSGW